jgi:hypothetical protein
LRSCCACWAELAELLVEVEVAELLVAELLLAELLDLVSPRMPLISEPRPPLELVPELLPLELLPDLPPSTPLSSWPRAPRLIGELPLPPAGALPPAAVPVPPAAGAAGALLAPLDGIVEVGVVCWLSLVVGASLLPVRVLAFGAVLASEVVIDPVGPGSPGGEPPGSGIVAVGSVGSRSLIPG